MNEDDMLDDDDLTNSTERLLDLTSGPPNYHQTAECINAVKDDLNVKVSDYSHK